MLLPRVPPKPQAIQALQSELQGAISEANGVVTSRGKGDHVSAKTLGSASKKLQNTLDTVMTAGLPESDALAAEAKHVVSTLVKAEAEVRQRNSIQTNVYAIRLILGRLPSQCSCTRVFAHYFH